MRQLSRVVVGAWCCFLFLPGGADAATGLRPDGEKIKIQTTGSGGIASPKVVELRVRPDAGDTDLVVWVSRSSSRTPSGTPARASVSSCRGGELAPAAEAGVVVCRLRTAVLDSATYYWWIVAGRSDGSPPVVAGPYSFTLAGGASGDDSTVTAAAAAKLVTRTRFTGERSIKHAPLTAAIARAFRPVRPPKTLAVACWTIADFTSIVASTGVAVDSKESRIYGIWFPPQPRWLHLSGRSCSAFERVLRGSNFEDDAFGLVVALHEAAHAYGVLDEAKADCYAVQLVPLAARALGIGAGRADRLGRVAVTYMRESALDGYWDGSRCRAGGPWDLPRIGTPLGG